jgi:hypothetical protein
MAITRWWQLALGALAGAMVGVYYPWVAFAFAITLGLLLAWVSLRKDGDDAMTAISAGFLTGVLGYGLIHVTAIVIEAPFQ